MEVCSNFSSMEELHKESDIVVKKATPEELKTLIPDPAKGAMSVAILRWVMNQADSSDARQRAKWAKYKQYRRPRNHRASVYFTTNTLVVSLEEDQEQVAMKVEEDGVPGHRSLIIERDSAKEEGMDKTKTKAKATRRSNRLRGP
ncbi:Chitinase domain-containing protein 1 [Hordeum vulgare]|nr:Chitinase domain-containing protein 1 [Hordeum vulgare]